MLCRPFKAVRYAACVALVSFSTLAPAHERSIQECMEGSEFIEHAAMSRDNGHARERFMSQLYADLEAIRAFPEALRWFVQDPEDQALLVSATEEVFDKPREPTQHRGKFMEQCLTATTSMK